MYIRTYYECIRGMDSLVVLDIVIDCISLSKMPQVSTLIIITLNQGNSMHHTVSWLCIFLLCIYICLYPVELAYQKEKCACRCHVHTSLDMCTVGN